ncbi:TPA: hypothetical protein ACNVX4_005945 [Pseudomonas aeruginosa]|uniref:hypothetical protein n=1 Tax=Pseudomonas aeruginosa TaxID=287 RepID=UPI00093F30FD|nr:hypothetical protein [Pseudomonas aeruginosa]EKF7416905.1 hypothetical protein [Pseudomonas aeruginosa]EKX3429688.1 hypothetical protein [Pseudomonas aeruginosa]MDS9918392.1 hypothetical protein [Pseudomonas aeruginosa]CAI9794763.1 hypothetical protein PAER4782_34260 [Pseudomonas aeruginosa]CAI9912152.1 hypothetical protein PAER4782_34260 [Pseudomonas aeruginosa]
MATKPEPTLLLRIKPSQLWLLKEQLNAASDPDQRSADEQELIALVETTYAEARRKGKIK